METPGVILLSVMHGTLWRLMNLCDATIRSPDNKTPKPFAKLRCPRQCHERGGCIPVRGRARTVTNVGR